MTTAGDSTASPPAGGGGGWPLLALGALVLGVFAPCTLFIVAPVGLVLALAALRRGRGVVIAIVAGLVTLVETVILIGTIWLGPIEIARMVGDGSTAILAELYVDATMLSSNCQGYDQTFGRPPEAISDLGWDDRKTEVWGNDFRTDPWGRPYRIGKLAEQDDETPVILSDGKDGIPGTADDIAIVDLTTNEPLDIEVP